MPFKRGNVVTLKSGGSTMTVETADEDTVNCVWSDGKKVLRESFFPDTLMLKETIGLAELIAGSFDETDKKL